MNSIYIIEPKNYPHLLKQIPDLPRQLYACGNIPSDSEYKFLTVIGSRRYTDYGKLACETLIAGLRGLPVVIVSGLAYGIDTIAHESAIRAGLKTLAIPGSSIVPEKLYPAANKNLAKKILYYPLRISVLTKTHLPKSIGGYRYEKNQSTRCSRSYSDS